MCFPLTAGRDAGGTNSRRNVGRRTTEHPVPEWWQQPGSVRRRRRTRLEVQNVEQLSGKQPPSAVLNVNVVTVCNFSIKKSNFIKYIIFIKIDSPLENVQYISTKL